MRRGGLSPLRRGRRRGKGPDPSVAHGISRGADALSPSLPEFLGSGLAQRVSACPPADLYCTLEVDSFGYFVSKAKTRVFRDTTEPKWDEVSGGDWCPLRDP